MRQSKLGAATRQHAAGTPVAQDEHRQLMSGACNILLSFRLRFLGFAGRVVLRPLRCGRPTRQQVTELAEMSEPRFQAHAWDGPFHRLVGKNAQR